MENQGPSDLLGSDILALSGNYFGLVTLGIETQLKTSLLVLIFDFVHNGEVHVQIPCDAIINELGLYGEQYRENRMSSPVLGKDVWHMLILVVRTCDVLQDKRKFKRLTDLTARLNKGICVHGDGDRIGIACDEPDLPTWFNMDLKPRPQGVLDSERNIHRVIYFIGGLCAHCDALLPMIRDELFMPCAALITMDIPKVNEHTLEPQILSGSTSTDNRHMWATQITIAAQWMTFCSPRFVDEAWKHRFREARSERLPWPVHATYPNPDGQKWQIWMAWKSGFRRAAAVLSKTRETDHKAETLERKMMAVLRLMAELEEEVGEEAERQRDIREAKDEGAERVEV
ncbi:hypothetical protein LIA77_08803 [Sarocladium implicatum]|nr:hypothetical protein LIA77_08803 [Sarocladium implicatum]